MHSVLYKVVIYSLPASLRGHNHVLMYNHFCDSLLPLISANLHRHNVAMDGLKEVLLGAHNLFCPEMDYYSFGL